MTYSSRAAFQDVKRVPTFQVGDVVQLKSGGPKMTVSKVEDDGKVSTTFFHQGIHQGLYAVSPGIFKKAK